MKSYIGFRVEDDVTCQMSVAATESDEHEVQCLCSMYVDAVITEQRDRQAVNTVPPLFCCGETRRAALTND